MDRSNANFFAGKQSGAAGPSTRGEILEDDKAYLGYAAAEAAALSPPGFVAAAGHDIGKQILGLCHNHHTAMGQFQAEQNSQVAPTDQHPEGLLSHTFHDSIIS